MLKVDVLGRPYDAGTVKIFKVFSPAGILAVSAANWLDSTNPGKVGSEYPHGKTKLIFGIQLLSNKISINNLQEHVARNPSAMAMHILLCVFPIKSLVTIPFRRI